MNTFPIVETSGPRLHGSLRPARPSTPALPDPIEQLGWLAPREATTAPSSPQTALAPSAVNPGWMPAQPPWLLMLGAALCSAVLCTLIVVGSAALLAHPVP